MFLKYFSPKMTLWLQFVAEINTRENLVVLTNHYSFILKILYEIYDISTRNGNNTEIKKPKENKTCCTEQNL
jgi:hypothetical protein